MRRLSLLLFIARKYLFARKSYAIINIISAISIVGVAVGTMALFVVLSVFNGFEDLILNLFNNFHSDFKIESDEGKTFRLDHFPENKIRELDNVFTVTYVIEDLALARYNDRQHLVHVKAVSDEFLESANLDSIIVRGDGQLKFKETDQAILGAGVDYVLGVNPNDYTKTLSLFVPKRTAKASASLTNAFVSEQVFPASVFSVQQEFDESYIIIPFETGKRLYDYENEVTSVEIMLKNGSNLSKSAREIERILGSGFSVKDRYQQQEFIYKILKSEKLAIFMILSFILLIATFNVIGTLSMIILEKRKDISVLGSMGASLKQIRQLFVIEGLLVIFLGASLGVICGVIISWLQQRFGLLGLGDPDAGFVVQAYPVKIKLSDFLIVFTTVGVIGFLTSLIPSRRINSNFASLNQPERE